MLKEHNREVYEATKNMLLEHRECCLVAATGIGKSNITTELIQELGLNALIIAPRSSIRDEWANMPDKYSIPPTFSTVTYQYFVRHYMNLYGFDAYIFDEAHHAGAPKWGAAIRKFRDGLDTEFVLGLTADPNRYSDKCKRDKEEKIITSVVKTVFNDHGVYGHDQRSAIENGILPRATYVCSIYNADEMFDKYAAMDLTEELRGRLNYTRTNCEAIEDTLRRNVPKGVPVKGIVFVDSIANIDIGVRLARRAFPKEAVHYIHSKLGTKENAETLEMFKNAKSGFIVSVDMIGEGLHIDGVNTVIMLRKTGSPSIYTQQIGRGLATGSNDATIFDFVRNDTSIKKVLARIKDISESYQNNEEGDTINKNSDRTRYPKISDQFIVKDKASDILEIFDEIDRYTSNKSIKHWTKEEDRIILEKYPIMGRNVSKELPNRSQSACICRARKLGISHSKYWSAVEDAIIINNYEDAGVDIVKLLPNRTYVAIQERATKLGIRKLLRWTAEEDRILIEKYPELGSGVSELLSGRSANACNIRAMALGIRYLFNEWTVEEDKIILDFYPLIGEDVCSKLPGRTKLACKQRAYKLKVKNPRYWTDKEDDIIRRNYPIMGYNVYKLLENRSIDACCARAELLNVKYAANRWTEEEDKILIEKYPIMGYKAFELITTKTFKACRNRTKILGL